MQSADYIWCKNCTTIMLAKTVNTKKATFCQVENLKHPEVSKVNSKFHSISICKGQFFIKELIEVCSMDISNIDIPYFQYTFTLLYLLVIDPQMHQDSIICLPA